MNYLYAAQNIAIYYYYDYYKEGLFANSKRTEGNKGKMKVTF